MSRLETAIAASVAGGNALKSYEDKVLDARPKESLRDVVTAADVAAENAVLSAIALEFPGDTVLSEEKGLIGAPSSEYWIVDALDGTVNFLNGIPTYCVSIAYWRANTPLVGAIYNPVAEELYYAEAKAGAFLNEKKLLVEDRNLANSLTAMAFSGKSYDPRDRKSEFQAFGLLNDLSQGCLRTGSAGLNLGYVAQGKLGLAVGKANKLWDVAAGFLIASEAGASAKFMVVDQERHLVDYVIGTDSAVRNYSEGVDYVQPKAEAN